MRKIRKIWDNKDRKQFVSQNEMDMDVPDGDIKYGEQLFNEHCSNCHSLDGNNTRGPSHFREVYNNSLGVTVPTNLTKGMAEAKGLIWTPKKLFCFLEKPEEVIPDAIMNFHEIADPYDRACIIEYLHYLRVGPV